MSDSLRYNEPVGGPSVATDEVSGRHYQWFKLDVGPPDATIPLSGTIHGIPVDVQRVETSRITLGTTSYEVKWASINVSGAGDSTLVPAVPGRRIRVLAATFTIEGGNVLISWKSGAVTTAVSPMSFATRQLFDVNRMPYGWFVETAPGQPLVINLSANRDVRGSLNYIEA